VEVPEVAALVEVPEVVVHGVEAETLEEKVPEKAAPEAEIPEEKVQGVVVPEKAVHKVEVTEALEEKVHEVVVPEEAQEVAVLEAIEEAQEVAALVEAQEVAVLEAIEEEVPEKVAHKVEATEVPEEVVLGATEEEVRETAPEEAVSREEISDQERCTKQFALNAARNVKYLSNLRKENQFTAVNVSKKEILNSYIFYLFLQSKHYPVYRYEI
jgi:hypothetical protein